ncbi:MULTISPECIES: hypothetical protein [unclassified Methylobacterium]|uniref:hypothetical protein n=1 Tax=unclassified Methylobacterium TaxID=2615210 RepID=UPI0006F34B29|nr:MULTISPECIES: hypothetical protein [unclassified Methylobacterium]KQO53584.1 hypothetical protein ASF24_04400 [Methylobacterium sp. Leaf86]KQO99069.1 hypothetical protein ASF32_14540 [Methylobacterium sp. Leaf91]
MSASPASKIEPNSPQAWREAFLHMKPSVVPCPGLTPVSWQAVHAASLDFLDKYADEAGRLGWTTLQLFGVHPDLGVIRSDFCGAMVLSGDLVTEVHPDFIRFARTRYFRNVPGRPIGAVPIWAKRR